MNGHFVISCPFLLINFFYNLLPCYPIPIGSYGPKTLLAYFQKFSKILFNIVIGQTFKLQLLVINFYYAIYVKPIPNFLPTSSNLSMHASH
jgi:hypothetical protein